MMMLHKQHIFFLFSIVFISSFMISSCICSSNDHHHDHDDPYHINNYFHDGPETTHHHPSYKDEDGEPKDLIKLRTKIIRPRKLSAGDNGLTTKEVRKIFSVDDYGAQGDGSTDDSQAFLKAWKAACSYAGAVLVVPEDRTYLLKPLTFSGPCKSNITMQIYGTLIASDDPFDYNKDPRYWIMFDNVQNLLVKGGGTINGKGNTWWKNSCKVKKSNPCKDPPMALTFYRNKDLVVKNLNIKDAQKMQVSFDKCRNVEASHLVITAPDNSPNTDGIHIIDTQNIWIASSTIGTGDDCISIVSGSENVVAENITCGPGHGISIGSLGFGNSKEYVSEVTVNGAKFSGTTNGVRIKTWQGGSGYASNIKFQNIEMYNVENPIIIDQHYCDQDIPCKEQKSAIQVKNVVYKNIKGTSASDIAVKFDCSKSYPCQEIVLENVKLELGSGNDVAKASCSNVKIDQTDDVSPQCPKNQGDSSIVI